MSITPRATLNPRQRLLLTLLDSLGGRVGNLDFQKLLFLRCQEDEASAPYEFVGVTKVVPLLSMSRAFDLGFV